MEINLDWDKRSNLVYAPENWKPPSVLEEHALAEAEVELTHARAPGWLKRHKTSNTTVYQRTGKTDPKDSRRYKRLSSKIEKLTPRTVQVNKGSFIRSNGAKQRKLRRRKTRLAERTNRQKRKIRQADRKSRW